MGQAEQQHLDWLARSLGRADYQPLTRADIESIQRIGASQSFAPGEHLFKQGEQAASTFLIEKGDVEIYRGKGQRRVVAHVGPASILGDMAMFGDRPHIASARALRPSRALRFDRSRLLPELAVHPGILLRWLVAGMRQIETSQLRVVRLMHKAVLAQVADVLVEESQRQPDVNLSQSTLAMLLGVSRQSVNEALGRLRDQEVVETGYRSIKVLDPDRLEEIAEV
ncbi:MAG: Crp/Fnr family transcriptional regulator [Actinomycetota bacterium]